MPRAWGRCEIYEFTTMPELIGYLRERYSTDVECHVLYREICEVWLRHITRKIKKPAVVEPLIPKSRHPWRLQ
jgi:hypothetical protein